MGIFHSEDGEVLAQAAQRSFGCPTSGGIQGLRAAWSWWLATLSTARFGTEWPLRSLPTQTVVGISSWWPELQDCALSLVEKLEKLFFFFFFNSQICLVAIFLSFKKKKSHVITLVWDFMNADIGNRQVYGQKPKFSLYVDSSSLFSLRRYFCFGSFQ